MPVGTTGTYYDCFIRVREDQALIPEKQNCTSVEEAHAAGKAAMKRGWVKQYIIQRSIVRVVFESPVKGATV